MNRCASLCFTVCLAACSPETPALLERTVTPIDAEGGVARSADGLLSLRFDPGTLSATTDIEILTRRDVSRPQLVALVYQAGPASVTLNQPVHIEVELADGTAGEDATLVELDADRLVARDDSMYRPETHAVVATAESLSTWSVASTSNPSDGGVTDGGGIDAGTFDAGTSTVPPTIVTTTVPDTERCASYIASLEGMASTGTVTWSIDSGTLPDGITLEADGTLAGAARESGTSTFTIRATDGAGNVSTRTFTIDVSADVGGLQWIGIAGRLTTATVAHAWVVDVCAATPVLRAITEPAGHPDTEFGPGVGDSFYRFRFAPKGDAVAYFASYRHPRFFIGEYMDVWVTDLTLPTTSTRATALQYWDDTIQLAWSEEGTKLAAADSLQGRFQVVDVSNLGAPSAPFDEQMKWMNDGDIWFAPDDQTLVFRANALDDGVHFLDVSNLATAVPSSADYVIPSVGDPINGIDVAPQWKRDSSGFFMIAFWYQSPKVYFVPVVGNTRGAPVDLAGDVSCEWQWGIEERPLRVSPDGNQLLAICKDAADRPALFVADISGPTPGPLVRAFADTPLTDGTIVSAKWAPDSHGIMFTGEQRTTGIRELYYVDVSMPTTQSYAVLSGNNLTAQFQVASDPYHAFGWSPDSAFAAFILRQDGPLLGDELHVVDFGQRPLGSQRVNEVAPDAIVRNFQFSPSARWIGAVTDYETRGHQLHVVDLSGPTFGPWTRTHPEPTTRADDLATPNTTRPYYDWFWTSDSRRLVVRGAFEVPSANEVWTIDISGPTVGAPVRISPAGATPTLDMFAIFGSGDYARPQSRRSY